MPISNITGNTLALSASIFSTIGQAKALQLADRTICFVTSPSLDSATTTSNNARVRSASYYFTGFPPGAKVHSLKQ